MSSPKEYYLLQDAYWPIAEDVGPHPSAGGSSPLGGPFYHMSQASLDPCATSVQIRETNDQEPLVGDENLWRIPSGGLKLMARPLFSQSAMDPKSATHAETSTHVDPYSNVNTLHQVNPQGFLAPMINPAFVNSTDTREPGVHGVGTTSGQPGVAQFFTQGLTNGPVPVGHPMNATVPMGGFGLLDFGPMIPFHGSSTLPEGVDMKFGDSPTRGGMHISFGLPRRTKTGRRAPVRSPPRTEEANLGILCARLLKEGADVEAVDFVRVIFAGAVTEEALRAPINTYEKWCEYSGATRVYQLLLKMKMEMSGETSYCCRLCPEMRRPEYKYERDAVRHLKRDHFGFAVACIYCERKYFTEAERKRHEKICAERPKVTP